MAATETIFLWYTDAGTLQSEVILQISLKQMRLRQDF